MDILNSLLDTIKGVAPTIAGGLVTGATGSPQIGGVVATVIRKIIGTTDDGSPLRELEARKVIENPEMYLKFRASLQELEIEKLREETKQMEIVNRTMQAEASSESKAQRGWRPFTGFMFCITLFCDYFVAQIVLAMIDSQMVWAHIPMQVYMLWTGVLGVTSGSRGIEKVAKISPAAGVMGILKSGFGK